MLKWTNGDCLPNLVRIVPEKGSKPRVFKVLNKPMVTINSLSRKNHKHLYFNSSNSLFMSLKRAGVLFLLGITVLAVIIIVLFFPRAIEGDLTRSAVRFFGLYGYMFLSMATLVTPFLREVTQAFGRPF